MLERMCRCHLPQLLLCLTATGCLFHLSLVQTLTTSSKLLTLPPLHAPVQVSPCTITAALDSRRLSLSFDTYADIPNHIQHCDSAGLHAPVQVSPIVIAAALDSCRLPYFGKMQTLIATSSILMLPRYMCRCVLARSLQRSTAAGC
jgi:hypothetical protein